MESGHRIYTFSDRRRVGEWGEKVVSTYLAKKHGLELREATREEQAREIDFVREDGVSYEIKTDVKSYKTGNAAIEIIKNNNSKKLGWAHDCDADWLILFFPHKKELYCFRPRRLSALSVYWAGTGGRDGRGYPRGVAHNPGYETINVLVPVDVVRVAADFVEPME